MVFFFSFTKKKKKTEIAHKETRTTQKTNNKGRVLWSEAQIRAKRLQSALNLSWM